MSPPKGLSQPLAEQVREVDNDWRQMLDGFAATSAGRALFAAVDGRVDAGFTVYPDRVFRALQATPLARCRIVIIGQDPYHGAGQADGLAFSVSAGQRVPPSLRNIFEECHREFATPLPLTGDLVAWAMRGVLLLNSILTVEEGRPGSHSRLGWQALTASIMQALQEDLAPKVFMLWGAHAQALGGNVDGGGPHRVLVANHPSPLSARRPPLPFIGCGHFSAASRFLHEAGRGAQDWSLPARAQ